jgi:hypothetical protein
MLVIWIPLFKLVGALAHKKVLHEGGRHIAKHVTTNAAGSGSFVSGVLRDAAQDVCSDAIHDAIRRDDHRYCPHCGTALI